MTAVWLELKEGRDRAAGMNKNIKLHLILWGKSRPNLNIFTKYIFSEPHVSCSPDTPLCGVGLHSGRASHPNQNWEVRELSDYNLVNAVQIIRNNVQCDMKYIFNTSPRCPCSFAPRFCSTSSAPR